MLRHNTGTPAKDNPCQHGADDGVSKADPGGGYAVFPAELSGITDKNNGGEIGSAVSKGGEPGADAPAAQNKTVYISGVFPAVESDKDHHRKKDDQHSYLENHNVLLLQNTQSL